MYRMLDRGKLIFCERMQLIMSVFLPSGLVLPGLVLPVFPWLVFTTQRSSLVTKSSWTPKSWTTPDTVIFPAFQVLRLHCQVNTVLEGSILVVENLSMLHILVHRFFMSPPEQLDATGVEACSVAGDWRGGAPLEQRHGGGGTAASLFCACKR